MITNKELIKAYDKFLQERHNCYADENGNRPCDNGKICNTCKDDKNLIKDFIKSLDKLAKI